MLQLKKNWFTNLLFVISSISLFFLIEGVLNVIRFDQNQNQIITAINTEDIKRYYLTQKNSIIDALHQLQSKQINSIVIREDTINTLIQDGKVTLNTGAYILNNYRIGRVYRSPVKNLSRKSIQPEATYLFMDQLSIYERIRDHLIAQYGIEAVTEKGWNTLEVFLPPETIRQSPIGFSKDSLSLYQSMNFSIIPTMLISSEMTVNALKIRLENLSTIVKPKVLLTQSKKASLSQEKLELISQYLIQNNVLYGVEEFSNQYVSKQVANHLPHQSIKFHTLNSPPARFFSSKDWISRYIRSIKERRVKLIILDPKPLNQQFLLNQQELLETYETLVLTIQKIGFTTDRYPLANQKNWMALSSWKQITLQLNALLLIILFIKPVFKRHAFFSLGILCTLFLFVILQKNVNLDYLVNQYLSLCLCCLSPFYAFVKFYPAPQPSFNQGAKYFLLFILKCLLLIFFIGTIVYILHSTPAYLMGFKQFFGVKLSFLVPLLLICAFFYLKPSQWKHSSFVLYRFLKKPMTYGNIALFVLISTIFIIYLIRSGNYESISIAEIMFRNGLEKTLFIRPRLKEMLIGYPSLVVCIFLIGSVIHKKWLWFYTMLSSIAFVSILNSFCHFHTPVLLSAYRSLLGLLIGTILGYFLLLFVQRFLKVLHKYE